MEESTKKKIHQWEIIGAMVLLLVSIASFFSNPGITGYVSVEAKIQKIDLTIANSQSYILTTNSPNPFSITNVKISGEVIGTGIAKVYLTNAQDQKILVYSNIQKKSGGLNDITGMDKVTGNVVGANAEEKANTDLVIEHLENLQNIQGETIAKEDTLANGKFENICIDSCFIEMLLNKDISYQLLFYVEEGTILKVSEISYTTKTD